MYIFEPKYTSTELSKKGKDICKKTKCTTAEVRRILLEDSDSKERDPRVRMSQCEGAEGSKG
jgi:hypothetical protein